MDKVTRPSCCVTDGVRFECRTQKTVEPQGLSYGWGCAKRDRDQARPFGLPRQVWPGAGFRAIRWRRMDCMVTAVREARSEVGLPSVTCRAGCAPAIMGVSPGGGSTGDASRLNRPPPGELGQPGASPTSALTPLYPQAVKRGRPELLVRRRNRRPEVRQDRGSRDLRGSRERPLRGRFLAAAGVFGVVWRIVQSVATVRSHWRTANTSW